MTTPERVEPGEHAVTIVAPGAVVDTVVAYAAELLTEGQTLVVISAGLDAGALDAALRAAGVDLENRRVEVREARETLATFMVDGSPDPARFDATVGELVRSAARESTGLHIYGDMVGALWVDGNVAGAIELERFWNELASEVPFTLLCGYPDDGLAAADDAGCFHEICHLHTSVVGAAPAAQACEVTRRFAGSIHDPTEARHFVAQLLEQWDVQHLADAALLVTTELVTNAIRHAGTDVAVSLWRRDGEVHIAVGDRSVEPPALRRPAPDTVGGRGLLLVDALAREWDCHIGEDSKLVRAVLVADGDGSM